MKFFYRIEYEFFLLQIVLIPIEDCPTTLTKKNYQALILIFFFLRICEKKTALVTTNPMLENKNSFSKKNILSLPA